MRSLSIAVNEHADDIKNQIAIELEQLKSFKIQYSIDEICSDNSTSIICSIDDDKALSEKLSLSYNTLIVHISNALADYIICNYEKKLLNRIVNSNYCYFNAGEKKDILNIAVKIIRNDYKDFLSNLFQMRRRNIIVKKLLDYFESSNDLVLDGFVNFRLKEYTKDLEEVVDKAVDEFLMEREYREFIRLLKYFVDIQDPKFDIIHVVLKPDNKYILLDENKKEITNQCIQDFVIDMATDEINSDDLLVSSLITLAPRQVIIHSSGQFKNKEILETIKNVFSGKVGFCGGCADCIHSMINLENNEVLRCPPPR